MDVLSIVIIMNLCDNNCIKSREVLQNEYCMFCPNPFNGA